MRTTADTYSRADLSRAIHDVMKPGGDSISAAAARYRVPYETLRGHITRYNGRMRGGQTRLAHSEELDICYALIYMAEAGSPPTRAMLRDLVRTYLNALGREDIFPNGNTPGNDWVSVLLVYTYLPIYILGLPNYLLTYTYYFLVLQFCKETQRILNYQEGSNLRTS